MSSELIDQAEQLSKYIFQNIKNSITLYPLDDGVEPLAIELSNNQKSLINESIFSISPYGPLSIDRLSSIIKNLSLTDPLFLSIRNLFAYFENPSTQTKNDGEGNMTLGIGLNLNLPQAEAVIIAVNKKFNLMLDYDTLKKSENQPILPLTNEQINYIFYCTLMGTKECMDISENKIVFRGAINDLKDRLASEGIAQNIFTGPQLISLLSLTFNAPSTIGPHLLQALSHLTTNGPMNVLIEIVERTNTNPNLGVGIAKRRVMEAALFVSDPENTHLSFRAATPLILADPSRPINGHNVHAQPYKSAEMTFVGDNIKHCIEGTDDKDDFNNSCYGTPTPDTFTMVGDGSKVVFGGDGDDVIILQKATKHPEYHVLAGGRGDDAYYIEPGSAKQILLVDSDGVGRVFYDGHLLSGLALQMDNKIYILSATGTKIKGIAQEEMGFQQTSHLSSQIALDVFKDNTFAAIIFPYFIGQYNIIPASTLNCYGYPEQDNKTPTILNNGNRLDSFEKLDIRGKIVISLTLKLYNRKYNFIMSRMIENLPRDTSSVYIESPGENGDFILCYRTAERDFHQFFDNNLNPISGFIALPTPKGVDTIGINWGCSWNQNYYCIGYNYTQAQQAVLIKVDRVGNTLKGPDIVNFGVPLMSSYSTSITFRQQGGIHIVGITKTTAIIMMYNQDMGLLNHVEIPLGENNSYKRSLLKAYDSSYILTDMRDGFCLILSDDPYDNQPRKLAFYQLNKGLSFVTIDSTPGQYSVVSLTHVNLDVVLAIEVFPVQYSASYSNIVNVHAYSANGLFLSKNSFAHPGKPSIVYAPSQLGWWALVDFPNDFLTGIYCSLELGFPPPVVNRPSLLKEPLLNIDKEKNEAIIISDNKKGGFNCEVGVFSDQCDVINHQDQTTKVAPIDKMVVLEPKQAESENLLKKFLNSPCRFANWCLDLFIKGALDIAHEAVEAGGSGYGKQKSVYELCYGVTMFNGTHVYIPELVEPCEIFMLGRK